MQPIQYKFDVTNIDPYVGGGAPLPSGVYAMQITNMDCKANNNAESGHNLALEYTVIAGEFKGRKYFENLNLWHTGSSAAVEIAEKQLSSIGHAVGVLAGEDLTVLANKPMLVELELQEATPDKANPNTGETIKGRGPQNRVIKRDPYIAQSANSGAAPQFAQQPQAAAAAQAPAFNPATAAAGAPIQAAQQAPAFNPAAAQAPANAPPAQAAAAPVNGAAVPPWQK